jgi:hypothetical protein
MGRDKIPDDLHQEGKGRKIGMRPRHRHEFVEHYDGLIAFGLSRADDERSITAFLQKFSDDSLMRVLVPRLSDQEIKTMVNLLTGLLRSHLTDGEYHEHFLKDK